MRFHSPATSSAATAADFFTCVSRHFCSVANRRPNLSSLTHISPKYRRRVISDAQIALIDYLHITRSLPYAFADNVANNSPFLLTTLISKLRCTSSTCAKTLQKFLIYKPVNEFELFLESIGIDPLKIPYFSPHKKKLFTEVCRVFDAARALSDFGFPWKMLGKLYEEDASIFNIKGENLTARVHGFKGSGFNTVSVICICLVFPYVLLRRKGGFNADIDSLFDDLKRVFIDFDLMSYVGESIDVCYQACRRIRLFYDFGCEKGNIGDLMGRNKHILFECSEVVLMKKVDFFRRLSANHRNVALLLLEKPEILNFELEGQSISVLGFLKHFGLSDRKLKSLVQDYPYVFGRNKIANLPYVMRALNLHEWFFDKIKNENHNLLADCSISIPNDEDIDINFINGLDRIRSSRTSIHTISKLNFLHEIGFGEIFLTLKVLKDMHGASLELQERFDWLLRTGIEFSKLCKMIALAPKILNQSAETLEKKVDFLCHDMGFSLQNLENSPAYLYFSLEDRIKPRYRFHMLLAEKGLDTKYYSILSLIATSENTFIAHLFKIHPALPKCWLARVFF